MQSIDHDQEWWIYCKYRRVEMNNGHTRGLIFPFVWCAAPAFLSLSTVFPEAVMGLSLLKVLNLSSNVLSGKFGSAAGDVVELRSKHGLVC